MNVFELIKKCAEVPSFSSYEERIHPLIKEILAPIDPQITHVADNNLVIYIPGKIDTAPVAFTAHLDKINHWGESFPQKLPCEVGSQKIIGQMDDAAGLGMCLFLALQSHKYSFPPLLLLLSEMEESTGLKKHPHLLKDLPDLYAGMGAVRLSKHILQSHHVPSCVITLDTTPEFRGDPGLAFYNKFWHMNTEFVPSANLQRKIDFIQQFFEQQHPDILISNANNDYIEYGLHLNEGNTYDIPSVALEPAIYPYHQAPEGVYCSDIRQMIDLLILFLETHASKIV